MLKRKAVCHEITEKYLFLFANRNNEEAIVPHANEHTEKKPY